MQRPPRFIRRRIAGEAGSGTVDFVVWFPFVMLVVVLILDIFMVLHGRVTTQRILEDANRAHALSTFGDDAAAAAFIRGALMSSLGVTGQVRVSVAGGMVTSSVRIEIAELQMVGVFESVLGRNATMEVSAHQVLENWEG